MIAPKITIARKSGAAAVLQRIAGVNRWAAYVGIPAASSQDRSAQLLEMAGVRRGKRAKRLRKAAQSDINNAELLFIFSKGSPVRRQPPRAVLEPAVQSDGARQAISRELAAKMKAQLIGDQNEAVKFAKRAALAGQNAARSWFTDPRNSWAPNAPSTIRAKGSDRPGIDTGAMRADITGIIDEE